MERLYTLTDRKSGYEFILHIPNGEAVTIYQANLKLSKRKEWKKVKTITYDNGVEFAYHDLISNDLNLDIFFANPYHSWERGTNENTNSLIRQSYFPVFPPFHFGKTWKIPSDRENGKLLCHFLLKEKHIIKSKKVIIKLKRESEKVETKWKLYLTEWSLIIYTSILD